MSRANLIPVLVIACAFLPFLNGCDGKQDVAGAEAASESKTAVAMLAAPEAPAAETPRSLPRKIIYTADVSMSTDHFETTLKKLTEAVKANSGYVAETDISGEAGEPKTGTYKIRIPVERFEAFMANLGTIGEISASKTTSQDVSEEFYDVAARLKNKRLEEERLLQLLRTATGKLQEILALEKEISRVREEIERIEGRLRFLSNQTDLTTVTITLRERATLKHPEAPSFVVQAQRTLIDSLVGLSTVAKGLLLSVIALLPWALVVAGIGFPFVYLHRKRQRQQAARSFDSRQLDLERKKTGI